jgi:phosphatidylserine/phosphatidylglycerophosphate/cardiolipin synthase-like enzyme
MSAREHITNVFEMRDYGVTLQGTGEHVVRVVGARQEVELEHYEGAKEDYAAPVESAVLAAYYTGALTGEQEDPVSPLYPQVPSFDLDAAGQPVFLERDVEAAPPTPVPPRPVPPPPPPPPRSPRPSPSRWTPIIGPTDLQPDNAVDFLIEGQNAFREMVDAIRTATQDDHYIYLLGWWLTDNFPLVASAGCPTTIQSLFAAAAGHGVQIRAMLWDQTGTQNTAEVDCINALSTGAAILDDNTFGQRIAGVSVGSHHQKVLIVKGSEGLVTFCGGIDINPDRVPSPTTCPGRPGCAGSSGGGGGSGSGSSGGGGEEPDTGGAVARATGSGSGGHGTPLHDVHCKITGPGALDLLGTFIQRWDAHPDHADIDRTKGNLLGRSEPRPGPASPRPTSATSTAGHCAVRITRTFNPVAPVPGTTVRQERTIRDTLTLGIQNARRFIYMEEQYLVNMDAARLLNRALSEIEFLIILIPDSPISDMPRVWEGRRNFIAALTAGSHGHKAQIFFLATPPNTPGSSPVYGSHTYVHAKTWVFDDELAVIGSANCNQRGWTHDSEVNAVIFEQTDPSGLTFAQRLRMHLWAEHLNVPITGVQDPAVGAGLWSTPPAGAHIRPYNPTAGSDGLLSGLVPWTVIDPSGPP